MQNRSDRRLRFYIEGIDKFALFCCCDLDLDPMTFIYELDPYRLKIYTQTKNELSTTRLSKVMVLQTNCTSGPTLARCGKAPWYLVDCCTSAIDVVSRRRLRSDTQQLMVVPRHRLSTVGRRAFAVYGPMV